MNFHILRPPLFIAILPPRPGHKRLLFAPYFYFSLPMSITINVMMRTTMKIPPIPFPIISKEIKKLFHINSPPSFHLLYQVTDTG